ncbi:MAG: GNAT family N-acetyltransferase [Paenibacillus sp.]|nr:GNAT family N-acetyltransferase [Paenibacillus sp.]
MYNDPFNDIFAIMEASFPISEFRTREGQWTLLNDLRYRLITDYDDKGGVIAFMAAWEFAEFRFVEHIAVHPAVRGQGLGDKLMKTYISESLTPVVLEVEPPLNEWSCRRIGFYERLGFFLNPFEYKQPPLREGQPELPLMIMSYAQPLTDVAFEHFKETVYRYVYKIYDLH